MIGKAPTYEKLENELKRRDPGTLKNDLRGLRHWQKWQAAEYDERATTLLADEETFESALLALVDDLRPDDGNKATRNARAQLKRAFRGIRSLALDLSDLGQGQSDTFANAIATCRRRLGLSKKGMHARYGEPFVAWERGARLPSQSTDSLERLRQFASDAGMPDEYLVHRLPEKYYKRRTKPVKPRDRSREYSLRAHGFLLPCLPTGKRDRTSLDDTQLGQDVNSWIQYKTEDPGPLNRLPESVWTFNAANECHSMKTALDHCDAFFGWLYKIGVPINVMTLAMAGDAVLVSAFDSFVRDRGAYRMGPSIAQLFSQLMMGVSIQHPRKGEVGFIRQQRQVYMPLVADGHDNGYLSVPAIQKLYKDELKNVAESPTDRQLLDAVVLREYDVDNIDELERDLNHTVNDRDVWRIWCDRNLRRLRQLEERSTHKQSFVPSDQPGPLQRVDRLIRATPERRERPIRVIQELMDAIRADRRCVKEGERTDILDSYLFLVAFAAALPVREANARHVRLAEELLPENATVMLSNNYRPSLFRGYDGNYWYSEYHGYFKNRKAMRAHGQEYYEVPLPSWFTPFLDWYLSDVRPYTAGGQAGSPYLFVAVRKNQGANGLLKPLGPGALAKRMGIITDTYLGLGDLREGTTPLGEGLRYHWIRHLYATDMLATHPEALTFVAQALNDSLETVRQAYDTSKPADALRWAGKHQDTVLG